MCSSLTVFHYRLDGQQAAMSNSIGAGPHEEGQELDPESSQWAAEEEVHDEDQQRPGTTTTTTTPIKERVNTTAPIQYQYNTRTIPGPYYNYTNTIPVSYHDNTSTILKPYHDHTRAIHYHRLLNCVR